jgi:hypothetical protein
MVVYTTNASFLHSLMDVKRERLALSEPCAIALRQQLWPS